MLTAITIENSKRIDVNTSKTETNIDFEDMNGSTTRIELTRTAAEYLLSELQFRLSVK